MEAREQEEKQTKTVRRKGEKERESEQIAGGREGQTHCKDRNIKRKEED